MIVQINFFSTCMAVVCSSVFILIFCFMRKSRLFLHISSLPGMILLCVLCILRLLIPIEPPGAVVISSKNIYNAIYNIAGKKIVLFNTWTIFVYDLLLIIWISVAIGLLMFFVVNYFQFYQEIRKSDKYMRVNLEQIINQVCGEKNEPLDIRVNDYINFPISCGIFRKIIVIPDQIYSDRELYYILKHESAHIKNGDLLIQFLINLLCSIYWWNPLVYMLRLNYKHYFELRCDQTVIENMTEDEKAEYLTVILKSYKSSRKKMSKREKRNLLERFEFVKDYKEKRNVKYVGSVILLVCFFLSYVFIFQSSYDPQYQHSNEHEQELSEIFEVDSDNSYLIQQPNGSYILRTPYGDVDIPEEDIKIIMDNFDFKEDLQ